MSVRYLEPGHHTEVPVGQIEVELTGATSGVTVDLESVAGTPIKFHRIDSTHLVLSPPDQPFDIVAAPSTGGAFADAEQIQLVVRVGTAADRHQLVGPKTNVGALNRPVIGKIEPTSTGLRVASPEIDTASDSHADLPGLAGPAMYVARSIRQQHQLPHSAVAVLIDESASMQKHFDSGVIQMLLEILLGIDRGLGDDGALPVSGLGAVTRPLPRLTAASVETYVEDHMLPISASTGFLAGTQSLQELAIESSESLVVLTDQLPPASLVGDGLPAALAILGDPMELQLAERPVASTFQVNPDLQRSELDDPDGTSVRLRTLVQDIVTALSATQGE
jgi:hypothetical protein